ncbi:calcium-binding protein [Microvirga antarctica]|uniref:calcium-binding protein n=1 Tax=Microvirga antarctica TaxID=2819233 RepID=UPI001B310789
MAYLKRSEYAAIRSDPTRIVDLYQTHKADFVADAGLQSASAEVQIAAFCTVVSYDLAPYGSSNAGVDLSALLSADLLSCGQYVQQTMFLIQEFGTLSANFHAVGWDDGAVGNHSQLFITTDRDAALLDPTIGLIVRNATLTGVATGALYPAMTSFFDHARTGGADISTFDETVKTAIATGAYKIRDGFYDYPSLHAWVYEYSEHTGLIVGNVRTGYLTSDNFTWAGEAYGGKGDDTITGSTGSDTLNGGKDNDWLSGLDGNDVLVGESGNDLLDGGAGSDQMAGGDGDDVYWTDSLSDVITEALSGGHDRISSSRSGIVLSANVEDAVVSGTLSLSIVGNALPNTLTGNGASNVIKGNAGDDIIRGLGGNDVIQGGPGADVMTGGAGVDRFVFTRGEAGLGKARDTITDFKNGVDRIDLRSYDANVKFSGKQHFVYIETLPFTAAGQLRTAKSGSHVILEGDTNGDHVADFQILLRSLKVVWTGDLIL